MLGGTGLLIGLIGGAVQALSQPLQQASRFGPDCRQILGRHLSDQRLLYRPLLVACGPRPQDKRREVREKGIGRVVPEALGGRPERDCCQGRRQLGTCRLAAVTFVTVAVRL